MTDDELIFTKLRHLTHVVFILELYSFQNHPNAQDIVVRAPVHLGVFSNSVQIQAAFVVKYLFESNRTLSGKNKRIKLCFQRYDTKATELVMASKLWRRKTTDFVTRHNNKVLWKKMVSLRTVYWVIKWKLYTKNGCWSCVINSELWHQNSDFGDDGLSVQSS